MASSVTMVRIKNVFDIEQEKYLSEKEILNGSGISRNTFASAVRTHYIAKHSAPQVGVFTGVAYVYEWVGGEVTHEEVEYHRNSVGKPVVKRSPIPLVIQKVPQVDIEKFLGMVEANPDALMSQIYNAASSAEKAKGVVGGLHTLIAAINQKQFESEN